MSIHCVQFRRYCQANIDIVDEHVFSLVAHDINPLKPDELSYVY